MNNSDSQAALSLESYREDFQSAEARYHELWRYL